MGFSWRWVWLSLAIFLGVEILLGGFLGTWVGGARISWASELRLDVLMILGSYLVGGLIVGLISPDVKILEPAVGAFIAVVLTFLFTVFVPAMYFGISTDRLAIGGGIAFVLAFFGARTGEKISAFLGNRASRAHFGDSP